MPASGADDLTFRARRILGEVSLVLAAGEEGARRLLAACDLEVPLAVAGQGLPEQPAGDVALLLPGEVAVPGPVERAWLCAALERGWRVEPVPGPVAPLAALVLSGLPADSFVYLGQPAVGQGRDLLAGLVAEPRTLLLRAAGEALPGLVALLHETLGDRPLVLVPDPGGEPAATWRGTTARAVDTLASDAAWPPAAGWSLVAGGATPAAATWDNDRLRAEIDARLQAGQPLGQLSRDLASLSGWPRREIYRLALAASKPSRPAV